MNSHKLFLMKMQDARPSTCHILNYCDKSQCHAGDADETALNEKKKKKKREAKICNKSCSLQKHNTYFNCHQRNFLHLHKRTEQDITTRKQAHMKLPCPLVLHEVRTLLKKLSCLPKNWPTHCARRQAFPPVSNTIPLQENRAKTEHKHNNAKNCHEQSHWCLQEET